MKKGCELCSSPARMYCESDGASLCWDCDANVHSANFLVAKHSRCLLCHLCQSLTPWLASGTDLGRTVSVCVTCAANNRQHQVSQPERLLCRNIAEEDDDEVSDSEGEYSFEEGDYDDEEGENQCEDIDVAGSEENDTDCCFSMLHREDVATPKVTRSPASEAASEAQEASGLIRSDYRPPRKVIRQETRTEVGGGVEEEMVRTQKRLKQNTGSN